MIFAQLRRKALPVAVFLALSSVACQALAALDVACVFEVRQTGADTNGGGFTYASFMSPPAAPSVSNAGTGGTVAANTYYCVITYTDAWGNTVISGQTSTTTSGTTSTITVTSPAAVTGAKTWNCYFGTTTGGPYFPQGTALTIGSNRVVTSTPPTSGTQPNGVDYSVQDSPQINVADGVANGTTTFTSATAAFTGAHVGNLIRVGTSTWRRIVGVTNGTTVVLDSTVGTNTGLPVVVGGAFATYGMVGAAAAKDNSICFIKYSATFYTVSASTNVSGGGTSGFAPLVFVGYDTNRNIFNRDANRPKLKPSANTMAFFTDNGIGSTQVYSNLAISNPDTKTSCKFIDSSGVTTVTNCQVIGLNEFRHTAAGAIAIRFCNVSVTTTITTGANALIMYTDWHDGGGITPGANSTLSHCNIYNTAISGGQIIGINGADCVLDNLSIYNVTSSTACSAIGIFANCLIQNCVVENINPSSGSGYVFDCSGSLPQYASIDNCYYYNIKTSLFNPTNVTPAMIYNATLLTASPFTAPGSGNFAPNTTAGGGVVIQSAGLPVTFPAGTTNNYLDAGAVQHQPANTSGTGKKAGPGGGRVGWLDRPNVIPFQLRESNLVLTRKAG